MWRKYRDKRTEAVAASRAATTLNDLRRSRGNRLEALKGDRLGEYSIRINGQYRICFLWPDDRVRAVEVGIVDYH